MPRKAEILAIGGIDPDLRAKFIADGNLSFYDAVANICHIKKSSAAKYGFKTKKFLFSEILTKDGGPSIWCDFNDEQKNKQWSGDYEGAIKVELKNIKHNVLIRCITDEDKPVPDGWVVMYFSPYEKDYKNAINVNVGNYIFYKTSNPKPIITLPRMSLLFNENVSFAVRNRMYLNAYSYDKGLERGIIAMLRLVDNVAELPPIINGPIDRDKYIKELMERINQPAKVRTASLKADIKVFENRLAEYDKKIVQELINIKTYGEQLLQIKAIDKEYLSEIIAVEISDNSIKYLIQLPLIEGVKPPEMFLSKNGGVWRIEPKRQELRYPLPFMWKAVDGKPIYEGYFAHALAAVIKDTEDPIIVINALKMSSEKAKAEMKDYQKHFDLFKAEVNGGGKNEAGN